MGYDYFGHVNKVVRTAFDPEKRKWLRNNFEKRGDLINALYIMAAEDKDLFRRETLFVKEKELRRRVLDNLGILRVADESNSLDILDVGRSFINEDWRTIDELICKQILVPVLINIAVEMWRGIYTDEYNKNN